MFSTFHDRSIWKIERRYIQTNLHTYIRTTSVFTREQFFIHVPTELLKICFLNDITFRRMYDELEICLRLNAFAFLRSRLGVCVLFYLVLCLCLILKLNNLILMHLKYLFFVFFDFRRSIELIRFWNKRIIIQSKL